MALGRDGHLRGGKRLASRDSREDLRPARVRVSWSTPAGKFHEGEFEGFMAACLQHEIDQCAGIFWLYRLSRLKRDRALSRFQKQRKNG